MKGQKHRLAADAPRGFGGSFIDRSKPLQFRLDGRRINGFAGDTVLSAVLAAGIDTLGQYAGTPIGLTPGSAPAIALAGNPGDAFPMARTPAVDGARYVTAAGRGSLIAIAARLFGSRRSMGVPSDVLAARQYWRALPANRTMASDLVVIGGGVAGCSAALAAARAGLRVTLVEQDTLLGGHSGLFGRQDDEDSPEDAMARLCREVELADAITVFTRAQVFAIRPGQVRLHQVVLEDSRIQSEILDIEAPRIVIATGSLERLPIFAGNRLPGVVGTLDAYELARRYGVWPGHDAIIATAGNPAYRLATLARDAGIGISRILDARPLAASRFIEFARAYGIVQSPEVRPLAATQAAKGMLALRTEGGSGDPLVTERLIVCGGWQPDLTLWHVAGGGSQWNTLRNRLEAIGSLDGVVLAGAAAGFLTRRASMQSGTDAINALLGRPRQPVEEVLIDPVYETPDGPCPVAPALPESAAFLDGVSLLPRPLPRRKGLFRKRPDPIGLNALSETPQSLTITEVAAGVDLGVLPASAAGTVAAERVAMVALTASEAEAPPAPVPAAEHIPPYLEGRLGPGAQLVCLVLEQPRRVDPGTMLYLGADSDQPLLAIGVVLRQIDGATLALVSKAAKSSGTALSLRSHGRAISVTIEA